MKISIEDKDKYIILRLNGEFAGTVTSNDILEKLNSLYEAGKYNIIIDMKNVEYADSLAAGVILFCLKEIEKFKGKLVLSSINPHIKKIVYATKLHTRIEIFDSLDDAENYPF